MVLIYVAYIFLIFSCLIGRFVFRYYPPRFWETMGHHFGRTILGWLPMAGMTQIFRHGENECDQRSADTYFREILLLIKSWSNYEDRIKVKVVLMFLLALGFLLKIWISRIKSYMNIPFCLRPRDKLISFSQDELISIWGCVFQNWIKM